MNKQMTYATWKLRYWDIVQLFDKFYPKMGYSRKETHIEKTKLKGRPGPSKSFRNTKEMAEKILPFVICRFNQVTHPQFVELCYIVYDPDGIRNTTGCQIWTYALRSNRCTRQECHDWIKNYYKRK